VCAVAVMNSVPPLSRGTSKQPQIPREDCIELFEQFDVLLFHPVLHSIAKDGSYILLTSNGLRGGL